jgi:hypothetical protein
MDAAMRIALRGTRDVTDSATGDALRKVRLGMPLASFVRFAAGPAKV